MAANGFFLAIGGGVVLCVLGQIFLEPLAYLLGSTKTILPYTKEYLQVILLGAPWMMASLVLNNQLRFQGSAMYSMVGITAGAVLNIALDPILMFTCRLGVAGAGWATIISQFVSFVILLIGCSKGGNISIHPRNFKITGFYLVQIVRGGLPSLARQSLASVATICLNHAARPYGDVVIAAMGVVQRISMFGASAMIGFGQGFQPVCGFNYGAGLYSRVKKGFWFCVKWSFVFLMGVSVLAWIFAPDLVALFRDDPAVIAFATKALRFQCISFPAHSWIVMGNMFQQVTGKTASATFMAMARQGIFYIPAVWLLTALFGELGIQMTQMVADILTLACAIPIQLYILSRVPKQDKILEIPKT